jgi:hypothetical protein
MKAKSLLLAIAIISGLYAFGQNGETTTEQYKFKRANLLKIDNTFGNVSVTTYSGAEINVRIDVIIDTKNKADAAKVREKINIRTSESQGIVSLVTENKINGMKTVRSFEINYTVQLPEKVALDVRNQFGDVLVSNIAAPLKLNVQHGDATVNTATGASNEFRVQFGDLRIESASGAEINLQHGDLHGGALTNIDLDHQFGDGKIENLSGENQVKIQHGDFVVDQLANQLKTLDIDAQFSSVELGNITASSYKISLDGSFTTFSWDGVLSSRKGGITVISERKETNRRTAELETGGSSTPLNTIVINAQHSNVKLQ